jgi:hypothetical protein
MEGYARLYGCSWEWLLTGKEIYPDTEKPAMLVHAPTEKYTHSDLKPEEGQRERLHAMLDTILDSGNIQLIKAIGSNLEQFVLLVRQERRLRVLERKAGIEVPENETDSPSERRSPSSKPR